MVWHASPHLASFPCGGVSAVVAGVNLSDAASYLNAAHPHPPLSANRLLSFTMKSTSCRLSGTTVVGNVSCFFGFQWIFAILEPSGNGEQLFAVTDGDRLPALVSSELGEREPAGHLHRVLALPCVLRGDGPAAQ